MKTIRLLILAAGMAFTLSQASAQMHIPPPPPPPHHPPPPHINVHFRTPPHHPVHHYHHTVHHTYHHR